MATLPNRHIIPGSERSAIPGAKAVATATPDERFEVTVRVRSMAPTCGSDAGATLDGTPPAQSAAAKLVPSDRFEVEVQLERRRLPDFDGPKASPFVPRLLVGDGNAIEHEPNSQTRIVVLGRVKQPQVSGCERRQIGDPPHRRPFRLSCCETTGTVSRERMRSQGR